VAGEIDPESRGDGGCLTKPERKAVVSSCGTRDGAHGTPCHALDPARENIHALESLNRYISVGLLGAKTEIPVECLQECTHV